MQIPKREPIGEDKENRVEHSEGEQSRKFYAVARHDEFRNARQQMRERQGVNEREQRGGVFECGHATGLL